MEKLTKNGQTPFGPGVVETGEVFVLPQGLWLGLPEGAIKRTLLFEGCKEGKGQLKLVILKRENNNYTEIGEGPGVWMDLQPPSKFVERYSCGEVSGGNIGGLTLLGSALPPPATDDERDYVLYVHGYNMPSWEKQRWIETTYKRLYWQGFKGSVGGFSWPCTNGADQIQFDLSEFRGWQAGARLREHIQNLNARGYRVHVMAHSQGNVVAAEAFRQWKAAGNSTPLARTYIAAQAAIPAHCYDPAVAQRSDILAAWPDVYSSYLVEGQTPAQSATLAHTWPAANPAYLNQTLMTGGAGTYVNFRNDDDYALTGNSLTPGSTFHPGWMIDQKLKNVLHNTGYSTTLGFFRNLFPANEFYSFPADRFMVFTICAPAHSKALGSVATGGVFGAQPNVNLGSPLFGYGSEHKYHSAQFRSNMAQRYEFWGELMFKISRSPLLSSPR